MSGAVVGALKKPQLRGLLHAQIKLHLMIGIGLSAFSAVAFKYGFSEQRKKIYAEFYKNYDIDKEFNQIRKRGIFQSCPAD